MVLYVMHQPDVCIFIYPHDMCDGNICAILYRTHITIYLYVKVGGSQLDMRYIGTALGYIDQMEASRIKCKGTHTQQNQKCAWHLI